MLYGWEDNRKEQCHALQISMIVCPPMFLGFRPTQVREMSTPSVWRVAYFSF